MDNRGDSFVLMMFPRYAGGKFITNCLSLSRHALPQEARHAKYLIEHPTDYDYRLAAVMSTLPSSDNMDQWIGRYEFGDQQLYGSAFLHWLHGEPNSADPFLQDLLQSGQKLFVTTHDGHRAVGRVLSVWPEASIIKLINHDRFRAIAQRLKGPLVDYDINQHTGDYCQAKYEQLAGGSWPSWQQFEQAGYDMRNLSGYPDSIVEEIQQFYDWRGIDNDTWLLDVDGSFFELEKFLAAIKTLYNQLKFDDFNRDRIAKFWQAYMKLHMA